MTILYYQLLIVASLIAARFFFNAALLIAVLWTVYTLLFVWFFSPLMILQLFVIWATYALLNKVKAQLI